MTRAADVASTTLPSWTTATRPSNPQAGQQGLNTTINGTEVYTGSGWQTITTFAYSVEFLVIAGGGAGGGAGAIAAGGGGGGAGGYRNSVVGEFSGGASQPETPLSVIVGTAYTVTVGAGGSGVSNANGTAGGNSVFGSITSIGGGFGSREGVSNGGSGGSGGGSGTGGANTGGAGTANQGNRGADGNGNSGGGGGGAGGTATSGSSGSGGVGGVGGNGLANSITGSSVTRGGGGGGGNYNGSGGAGGSGGGGAAGGATGTAGTVNTGSGGGGAWVNGSNSTGGNGGSGLVVIRYLGAQRGTGGTVTSAGGYTIHTFTTSGTYTA